MIIYHGTSLKYARRIMEFGLMSHSWVSSSSHRAWQFARIATLGKTPVVLVFDISQDDFKIRMMMKQPTFSKNLKTITGWEYLLACLKDQYSPKCRLRPIAVMEKCWS